MDEDFDIDNLDISLNDLPFSVDELDGIIKDSLDDYEEENNNHDETSSSESIDVVDNNSDSGFDKNDDCEDDDDDGEASRSSSGMDDDTLEMKKRQHHNLSEKQRREALKKSFGELKNLLPPLSRADKSASKAKILETSCSYIHEMLAKQKNWLRKIEKKKRENAAYEKKIEILGRAIKSGVIGADVLDACKPDNDN